MTVNLKNYAVKCSYMLRPSVSFSSVRVGTYEKMLTNQALTETITYGTKNLTLHLGKSNPETEQLYSNSGLELSAAASNLHKARKVIARMLNPMEILKNAKGEPQALVTGMKPPEGQDFLSSFLLKKL